MKLTLCCILCILVFLIHFYSCTPKTDSSISSPSTDEIDQKDQTSVEMTPNEKLFYCIVENRSLLIDLALEEGADPNALNEYEIPALSSAILYLQFGEQFEIIEKLVNAGADVNLSDKHKKTPVIYAATVGHVQTLDLLVSKGGDVNYGSDTTALMEAVIWDRQKAVKYLLLHGADPAIKNSEGKTAEDIAVEQNKDEIIQLFSSEMRGVNLFIPE